MNMKRKRKKFLKNKFDTVFEKYNILLKSSNYVTRRQSLKLLGELLLDRANFQVMMRYIQVRQNIDAVVHTYQSILFRSRGFEVCFVLLSSVMIA